MTLTQDRLRALIDVLVESVVDPAQGDALARRAYFSRFHFDRLVRAAIGETPAAFRRRLLLERAAHELGRGEPVAGAAVEAGYTSGEAFSRAFRRAYGVPPTRHAGDFRLPAPNGVHFHPPGGLLVPADERSHPMDLAERMVTHDNRLVAELIDVAARLDDAALDEPNPIEPPTEAFHEDAPSIRSMLNRLVFTKEMWSAAIKGRAFEESDDRSLDRMRERLEQAGREFAEIVRDVRARDAWDTAFVDASCEPPRSFTFAGAVVHVLTWDAHRRHIVIGALRRRGLEVARDSAASD
jgi:AraC family transcriptional regulator